METQMQKPQLRQQAKALRKGLNITEISTRIVEHLIQQPWWLAARHVLLYWPMPGEVDLRGLCVGPYPAPQDGNLSFYLPALEPVPYKGLRETSGQKEETFCFQQLEMLFRQFDGSDRMLMVPSWNIPQPLSSCPLWEPRELEKTVVLVPGLMFDCQGHRLGYGQGFYDRWRAGLEQQLGKKTVQQMTWVGVVAHALLRESPLPCEDWDRPVDVVITERGVVQCAPLLEE